MASSAVVRRRCWLPCSLELDLGAEEVRQKHTQLALAIAVVDAPFVDMATMACPERGITLAPRTTKFQLKIPPSPLKKVNTHPTDRPMDMNDHIINFFEGRTITEDRVVPRTVNGKKVATTETTEKCTHPLEACDVIASAALQREFNAYMKEHGQRVAVNCGNRVLTRDSRTRPATHQKEITAAFNLFLDAYKAKGLFPKAPDRPSTSSQTAAYLLRNDAFRFPAGDTTGLAALPAHRTLARSGLPGRRPAAIARARVHLETLSRREHRRVLR